MNIITIFKLIQHPIGLIQCSYIMLLRYFGKASLMRTPQSVKEQYTDIAGDSGRWYDERLIERIVNGKRVLIKKSEFQKNRFDEYASYINVYHPNSILEVGCGECTTIHEISKRIEADFHACDLTHQRLVAGKKNGFCSRISSIATASAEHLPYADNSFDVVYTASALEQMNSILNPAIKELIRVTKNYLVLFEPLIELAPPEQVLRMYRLDYLRGLENTIKKESSAKIILIKKLSYAGRPNMQVSLMIIKKC